MVYPIGIYRVLHPHPEVVVHRLRQVGYLRPHRVLPDHPQAVPVAPNHPAQAAAVPDHPQAAVAPNHPAQAAVAPNPRPHLRNPALRPQNRVSPLQAVLSRPQAAQNPVPVPRVVQNQAHRNLQAHGARQVGLHQAAQHQYISMWQTSP